MSRTTLVLSAIAAGMIFAAATPATAKQCTRDLITAASKPSLTKNLGAYPGSLFAWRKAASDQVGSQWRAWRNAEDRRSDCEQLSGEGTKRWVCTRTARACNGGGSEKVDNVTDPVIKNTLRRGDTGDEVKILQQVLAGATGTDLVIDGIFGRGTERAVRTLQREAGITVDGIVGPETIAAFGAIS